MVFRKKIPSSAQDSRVFSVSTLVLGNDVRKDVKAYIEVSIAHGDQK